MGRRVTEAAVRTSRRGSAGTQPIEFVDVVKNGELVFRKSADRRPPRSRQRLWVQIWFESSTEVFNGHRNPRGARPWRGSSSVEGASLLQWRDPWFAHPESYRVTRPDPAANRLDFQLLTRGRGTRIARARRRYDIDPNQTAARRDDGIARRSRRPRPTGGETPAEELEFALGDLDGRALRTRAQGRRNVDHVRSRIVAVGRRRSTSISSIATRRRRVRATGTFCASARSTAPWPGRARGGWVLGSGVLNATKGASHLREVTALTYETLLIDRSERIATVTLNRPQALNAVTAMMSAELTDVWRPARATRRRAWSFSRDPVALSAPAKT